MPYFTYVLKSAVHNRRYTGSCENMQERLKRHNAGRVRSTKAYLPFEIIYFEEFATRSEAYQRELFFKTPPGYYFLKEKGIY